MEQQMKTESDSIKELMTALNAAKLFFDPLKKSGINSFFKKPDGSKHQFSTLADIFDATESALANNDLIITYQAKITDSGGNILITTLYHVPSEQFIKSTSSLDLDNKGAQGIGSAITYFRRYHIQAMLNLESDIEDDGNAATGLRGADKIENKQPSRTYTTYSLDGGSSGSYTSWKSYKDSLKIEENKQSDKWRESTEKELVAISKWAMETLTKPDQQKAKDTIQKSIEQILSQIKVGAE
tara:strand:- start:9525 stop:10247 length:723 start_codon:yes stop_codon:yes gene_type:complete